MKVKQIAIWQQPSPTREEGFPAEDSIRVSLKLRKPVFSTSEQPVLITPIAIANHGMDYGFSVCQLIFLDQLAGIHILQSQLSEATMKNQVNQGRKRQNFAAMECQTTK